MQTAAPRFSRRDVLQMGGLLATGFSFPLPARAQQAVSAVDPNGMNSVLRTSNARPPARYCILVYLLGGPPQLDMWDLKPDAPAEIRGPFRPIATSVPGVQICEHLPRLARMAHRYALVRSVSHNNHNHTPMIYYTLTGRPVDQPNMDNDVRPQQRTDFPHLGAVLARFKQSPLGLPGYIAIPELAVRSSLQGEFKRVRSLLRGGGGGFLGPLGDPLPVDGEPGTEHAIPALRPAREVAGERLENRAALVAALENRSLPNTQVYGTLRRQAVLLTGIRGGGSQCFSLDAESDRVQERYGRHRFGKAMLLARRLAEAGVPMTAIHFNEMTICDGWDTHSKNFEALQTELLPMLDQSLSALLEDLEQRGLLEQTVVVVMGEFGRTPRINAAAGRDHWGLCQSVLLAGGGIKAGQVYGSSDRIAAYPNSEPVDPVDIHATVYHCLGVNPEGIIRDHIGRPYPICTGGAIRKLIA